MKRHIWLTISLFLLLLISAVNGAAAEAMHPSDAQAIRIVIQSQLDAFEEDDAVKAFDLAAASTRVQLGDAENFLRLIKEKYPPIYRHRLAIFSAPEMVDGYALQIVRLTDRDNLVWLAVYRMQRETDGNWKIEGCRLLETTSISV